MNHMIKFTEEQQKIIDLKEGIHLVLAPPGSGKTELLATRVEKAINDGYKEDEIICLTFTNRAAKGMKDRIEKKYPQNSIIIGNIHNYCTKFLFDNRLISANTSILDEEEVDNLLTEIKREIGYKKDVYNPNILRYNTYLKQKELNFDEKILLEPKYSNLPDIKQITIICEKYEKIKAEYSFIDFDDILTITYNFLIKKTGEYSTSGFKWVQVDEVQDLNPLQWGIIDCISNKNSLKVFFGDYEQAIFSFMGAKLNSLHEFENICEKSDKGGVHNLTKNFRSPSYLLNLYIDYAKALLLPTWKRDPIPNMITSPNKGDLRVLRIDGSVEKEARIIVEIIKTELLKNKNESTAIIVRYNNTADMIDSILKETDINYFKVSGFDLFRRKSVKGLLSFLSILLNEFDKISWIRLFYEFGLTVSLKESRSIVDFLFKNSITPIDFVKYDKESTEINEFVSAYSNTRVIVFDTESTGLNTSEDDIIQIAALEVINGKVNREFEVYINTNKDFTESEKLHHISKEFLNEHGVNAQEGLKMFVEFINKSNTSLVAHNLSYDYQILKSNLKRHLKFDLDQIELKYFDTLKITKLVDYNLRSYKLEDLIKRLDIEGVNSHNALDDVKATVNLIVKIIPIISKKALAIEELYQNDKFLKFIDKFNMRVKPLYNHIDSNLKRDITIQSVIDLYFKYAVENKFIDERDYHEKESKELQKLLRHLDINTKNDIFKTLRDRLENYLPEYLTYKESDLYRGDERVVLSTVYKAKGLEFDNVIIAETTDNTYPSWFSKNEEEITEDARALYVALTRAKKRIIITSHSIFITRYRTSKPREESPFINPIRHHFENESC